MKTKFIGLDGYGEIETLKTTRKIKKHYAKRTADFFKKSVQMTYCFAKSFEKPKRRVPQHTPTLDACYRNARMGKKSEYSVKILDFSHTSRKQQKKKSYAVHYTRGLQPISGNFLKHKAALGTMTASVAGVFAVLTVFSAMGAGAATDFSGEKTATLSQQLSYNQNFGGQAFINTATADSASPVSSSVYTNIALAVSGNKSTTGIAGLYIDGKFIGAADDEYKLYEELDRILSEYAQGYDETTSVKYESDVEVKTGDYNTEEIVTAKELAEKASKLAKISLTTDVTYERETDYDTDVEYDDSQNEDYEKVKQEGAKGIEKVTCKATYVDGELVDSQEIGAKVIKEPVNRIVVKGTKETSSENTSSQSGNSATGSFIWPVPNTYNVTSGYGYRWGTIHTGIDISNGVTDETIVASDSGTVTWAGYDNSGYGNYVVIDHGNGYQTLYGHCNSVYVSQGEYVSQGQSIAGMGSTGDSTGTHLHFEIRLGSERLNPADFF